MFMKTVISCVMILSIISMATSCVGPPDAQQTPTVQVHQLEKAKSKDYSWGWIRWLINSEIEPQAEMTLGVVELNAGQRNPLHVHNDCEEYLYVLSGSCEHRIEDRWITLKAGDVVRIPAGVSHMARTTEEPMRALIVYSAGARDFVLVEEGAGE